VLPGGYYRALGRVDDTMNLGGIKVSSVEIERCLLSALPGALAEVAAVGVPAPGGGPELLHLFVVLPPSQSGGGGGAGGGAGGSGAGAGTGPGQQQQQALAAACGAALKSSLNPLFKVHRVLIVPSLPRTASNKVMRRVLRDAALADAAAAAGARAARPRL
jgi:acyl-coenzyme A synthetase/AMP-(fatty) acid ligase